MAATGRAYVADSAPKDVCARWTEYYATVYQVPVDLVAAIIDVESGWNPYAVSKKGAAGIMQLMPATEGNLSSWAMRPPATSAVR